MMGAQGTVLALVALAICRGRLRPAWQAAVWLVVLVKFVLPWGPAMPWSLADLFAIAQAQRRTHRSSRPIAGRRDRRWPTRRRWLDRPARRVARARHGAGPRARRVARHRAAPARRAACRAGAVATAREGSLAELAARNASASARRAGSAVGSPDVGPHVVGVRRPVIVVPPSLLDDASLLRAALLHELAHVRRRDALARLLQLVATSLFWFWPITRAVARRLDHAREAACDALALEAGELPRPAYARLLVAMARLQLAGNGDHALAMAAHHLDARVAAVLAGPGDARLGRAHRLAVAAFAVIALGGARTAHAHAASIVRAIPPQLAARCTTRAPRSRPRRRRRAQPRRGVRVSSRAAGAAAPEPGSRGRGQRQPARRPADL